MEAPSASRKKEKKHSCCSIRLTIVDSIVSQQENEWRRLLDAPVPFFLSIRDCNEEETGNEAERRHLEARFQPGTAHIRRESNWWTMLASGYNEAARCEIGVRINQGVPCVLTILNEAIRATGTDLHSAPMVPGAERRGGEVRSESNRRWPTSRVPSLLILNYWAKSNSIVGRYIVMERN